MGGVLVERWNGGTVSILQDVATALADAGDS